MLRKTVIDKKSDAHDSKESSRLASRLNKSANVADKINGFNKTN